MWLLDTKTLRLEERDAEDTSYAILSHRWEDEELSFGDMENLKVASQRRGYRKVENFCAFARERRYGYAWVDTCCIDKKNSVELSEAINSMYKWYRLAGICFVYLHDVTCRADLERSSWFSRGWTLQELLAPVKLLFLDQLWKPLFSRKQSARRVAKVTGIPPRALTHFNPSSYCIVERLSWAACRVTKREEDRAYCLLGLLDINMPLLYGEGNRAFQRLQEEIMKVNTDMSLFLWRGPADPSFGMLAADPSCFRYVPPESRHASCDVLFCLSDGWNINNAGISMTASIEPYLLTEELDRIFALYLHQPHRFAIPGYVIFVQEIDSGGNVPTFARAAIGGETWQSHLRMPSGAHTPFPTRVTELRLTRQPLLSTTVLEAPLSFRLRFQSCSYLECTAFKRPVRYPRAKFRNWPECRRIPSRTVEWEVPIWPRIATGLHCCLTIKLMDDVELLVCLGMDDTFKPLCIVLPLSHAVYNDGLDERMILRGYCRRATCDYQASETVITQAEMICVRGREREAFLETPVGLNVEISESFGSCDKYTATIDFSFEDFIHRYLPDTEIKGDSLACISRDVFGQLRDIEVILETVRRKEFLLGSRTDIC